MQHHQRMAKLMQLSWQIQNRHSEMLERKSKRYQNVRSVRSLALEAAWSIVQTEQVTIHHLVKRHSHDHYANKVNPNALTLFSNI